MTGGKIATHCWLLNCVPITGAGPTQSQPFSPCLPVGIPPLSIVTFNSHQHCIKQYLLLASTFTDGPHLVACWSLVHGQCELVDLWEAMCRLIAAQVDAPRSSTIMWVHCLPVSTFLARQSP